MQNPVASALALLGLFLAVFLPSMLKGMKRLRYERNRRQSKIKRIKISPPTRSPTEPKITRSKITIRVKIDGSSSLHREEITAADVAVIEKLELKDWCNTPANTDLWLKCRKKWIASSDRSVILIAQGGGSFEIPQMYDFVYKENTVRIHCGGGGDRAVTFTKNAHEGYDATVHVSDIQIPPALIKDKDSLLVLIAEAFAVDMYDSTAGAELAVEFTFRIPAEASSQ